MNITHTTIGKEPVPWAPTTAYKTGMRVLEDGVVYVSNWWTRNCRPSTNNGDRRRPWTVFTGNLLAPPVIAIGLAAAAMLPNVNTPRDMTMPKTMLVSAAPAGDGSIVSSARTGDACVGMEPSDTFCGPNATLADIDPSLISSALAIPPRPSFDIFARTTDADEAWSATFALFNAPTLADFAATDSALGKLLASQ